MTRILMDADLPAKLRQLTEPAELCDEAGKVVGRFDPIFDPSKWEMVGPEVTDEELERRANSNERRYTTAEVLAYLEKLDDAR